MSYTIAEPIPEGIVNRITRQTEETVTLRLARLPLRSYLYFVVAYFLTTADIFVYQRKILPIAPIRIFVLTFAPLMLIIALKEVLSRPPLLQSVRIIYGNALALSVFILIIACAFTYAMHPTAYWANDGYYIKQWNYTLLVFAVAFLLPLLKTFRESFKGILRLAFISLLLSIMVDLIQPGTLSKSANRAAGLAINANLASLLATQLVAVLLSYDFSKRRRDLLLLGVLALAVLATLSRGGMVQYLVLLLYYGVRTYGGSKFSVKRWIAAIIGGVGLVTAMAITVPLLIENSEMFSGKQAQERLAFFSGEQSLDTSDESRVGALQASIRLINEAPVLGHGTAFSYSMSVSPHNLYIQQWINNGLLGLSLSILLFAVTVFTFRRRSCPQGVALILVTAIAGFFSHNILDHRSFLMLLGFMLSMSLFEAKKGGADKKSVYTVIPIRQHIY